MVRDINQNFFEEQKEYICEKLLLIYLIYKNFCTKGNMKKYILLNSAPRKFIQINYILLNKIIKKTDDWYYNLGINFTYVSRIKFVQLRECICLLSAFPANKY